jgi:hypothetical protein
VSAPTTQAPATTTVAPVVPAPDAAPAADSQAPAATEDTTPVAPVAPTTPAAPNTFTISGTINGIPAGTTVTITFTGADGSFQATADAAGNFAVSGLPAGDYQVIGQWVDSTNSATAAQRFGTVSVTGDASVSLSFAS